MLMYTMNFQEGLAVCKNHSDPRMFFLEHLMRLVVFYGSFMQGMIPAEYIFNITC